MPEHGPDALDRAEREAIKLARSIPDDLLADRLRLARSVHIDEATAGDLRTLGARAFVLARRRDPRRDA